MRNAAATRLRIKLRIEAEGERRIDSEREPGREHGHIVSRGDGDGQRRRLTRSLVCATLICGNWVLDHVARPGALRARLAQCRNLSVQPCPWPQLHDDAVVA